MHPQGATKAINQKNEDALHGKAVKRGAPFALVKPAGMVVDEPKKGGKTGIAHKIKNLTR